MRHDNCEDKLDREGLANIDTISLGFKPIWDVLLQGSNQNWRQDNFADFWQAFKNGFAPWPYFVHFAKMAIFQNTIDYDTWTPTCTIGNLTGTWQISPVTLTATAFPPDPDPEDQPYLSVLFQYSRVGPDQGFVDIDTDSTSPYSITWNPSFQDDSVWARAFAMDGFWYAPTSATGPFGVSSLVDPVGYWHFDGNANDSSGFGNNGTVYGASFVSGRVGQALNSTQKTKFIRPENKNNPRQDRTQ